MKSKPLEKQIPILHLMQNIVNQTDDSCTSILFSFNYMCASRQSSILISKNTYLPERVCEYACNHVV